MSNMIEFIIEQRRIRISRMQYLEEEMPNPGNYISLRAFDYFKCIFVHVPKSAGVSVSTALFGNYAGGHKTLRYYQDHFNARTFNKYFKFSFVRDPYDRLHSAYYFLKKGGMNDYDLGFKKNVLDSYVSFEDFVMKYLNEGNLGSHIHFFPQWHFLRDKNDTLSLDFIGRFENLEHDFQVVCKELRLDKKLTRENTGAKEVLSFRDEYTPEMIQKVNLLYTDDFRHLGYIQQNGS